MKSLFKFHLIIHAFLIFLCNLVSTHPIPKDAVLASGTGNTETFNNIESILIVIGVCICTITILVGCLCCDRNVFKVLDSVHRVPVHDGYVNANSGTEFTIFPPRGSNTDERGSLNDVKFEPLPDIRPRGRSASGSHRPRPASFCSVVNRGLSVEDWFEDPSTNFPRNQLQYLQELGSGWFGQVVEGEAQGINRDSKKTKVVVKILRDDATPTDQIYFLHEVRAFRDIDHPNVMKLLGKCLETDPFLIILEHCAFKDLKTYLIQHRTESESLIQGNILLRMICNIAAGLSHMHRKNFVHTDLATRNCLVTNDLQVKIGDYGNSIEKFKDDYYCATDMAVPIRWCAPESLRCTETTIEPKEVTPESNIWSFGVVTWEVLEFAKLPYGNLNEEDVLQKVVIERFLTLSQPLTACAHKDKIYQVMQLCWLIDPKLRPNMDKVQALLSHLYTYCDASKTPMSDFEARWNALQPRTNARLVNVSRDVSAAGDAATQSFETDFSHTAVPSSPHPSAFSFDFTSSPASNLSPSLQNLRGSLDDLNDKTAPLTLSEQTSLSDTNLSDVPQSPQLTAVKPRSSSVDYLSHVSGKMVQREFDRWLVSQQSKGDEESKMARQISEAIVSLDAALADQNCTSSEESNHTSPERELTGAGEEPDSLVSLDGSRNGEKVTQLVKEKSASVQDFLKLTIIDSDNSDSDVAMMPNGEGASTPLNSAVVDDIPTNEDNTPTHCFELTPNTGKAGGEGNGSVELDEADGFEFGGGFQKRLTSTPVSGDNTLVAVSEASSQMWCSALQPSDSGTEEFETAVCEALSPVGEAKREEAGMQKSEKSERLKGFHCAECMDEIGVLIERLVGKEESEEHAGNLGFGPEEDGVLTKVDFDVKKKDVLVKVEDFDTKDVDILINEVNFQSINEDFERKVEDILVKEEDLAEEDFDTKEDDILVKEVDILAEKDFGTKEEDVLVKEMNFLEKENDFFGNEKEFGVEEENILVKEVDFFDKEQDFDSEEEDLAERKECLAKEEDVLVKGVNIFAIEDDIFATNDNLVGAKENLFAEDQDFVVKPVFDDEDDLFIRKEDVLIQVEDFGEEEDYFLKQEKDFLKQEKDFLFSDQDFVTKIDDFHTKQDDIYRKEDILSKEYDILTNRDDILEKDDDILIKEDDVLRKETDIATKDDDFLKFRDIFEKDDILTKEDDFVLKEQDSVEKLDFGDAAAHQEVLCETMNDFVMIPEKLAPLANEEDSSSGSTLYEVEDIEEALLDMEDDDDIDERAEESEPSSEVLNSSPSESVTKFLDLELKFVSDDTLLTVDDIPENSSNVTEKQKVHLLPEEDDEEDEVMVVDTETNEIMMFPNDKVPMVSYTYQAFSELAPKTAWEEELGNPNVQSAVNSDDVSEEMNGPVASTSSSENAKSIFIWPGSSDEEEEEEVNSGDLGFPRPMAPEPNYSPDWESESEESNSGESSSSSTSGEFDCSKSLEAKAGKSASAEDVLMEVNGESSEEKSGSSVRVSTWDKDATPKRSSLKISPEKKTDKKSVSFEIAKTPFVYEYPKERRWDETQARGMWTLPPFQQHINFTDWEMNADDVCEDMAEIDDSDESAHGSTPVFKLNDELLYRLSDVPLEDLEPEETDQVAFVDPLVGPITYRELFEHYRTSRFYPPPYDEAVQDDLWLASNDFLYSPADELLVRTQSNAEGAKELEGRVDEEEEEFIQLIKSTEMDSETQGAVNVENGQKNGNLSTDDCVLNNNNNNLVTSSAERKQKNCNQELLI